MKAFGLARIGRDAEIRHTAGGDAVASLSLAFTYGRKGEDGKRPTQWVDASLWGKRAEALAQYLTKGSLVAVTPEDVVRVIASGLSAETTLIFAARSAGNCAATSIAAVRAGPSAASTTGNPCGFFFANSNAKP